MIDIINRIRYARAHVAKYIVKLARAVDANPRAKFVISELDGKYYVSLHWPHKTLWGSVMISNGVAMLMPRPNVMLDNHGMSLLAVPMSGIHFKSDHTVALSVIADYLDAYSAMHAERSGAAVWDYVSREFRLDH